MKNLKNLLMIGIVLIGALTMSSCGGSDLAEAIEDVVNGAQDLEKSTDLEGYWEGYGTYDGKEAKVYVKFGDISESSREVYKIDDKIVSNRTFSYSVDNGSLTLKYNDGTTATMSSSAWSYSRTGMSTISASFTNNGIKITWNNLNAMTFWSDSSL